MNGKIIGLLVVLSAFLAAIGCGGDGSLEEIRLLQDRVSALEAEREEIILPNPLVDQTYHLFSLMVTDGLGLMEGHDIWMSVPPNVLITGLGGISDSGAGQMRFQPSEWNMLAWAHLASRGDEEFQVGVVAPPGVEYETSLQKLR